MTTTHDVPMPEPDVTVAIDTDGIPRSLQGRFYTAGQVRDTAIKYADARCAKLQAELANMRQHVISIAGQLQAERIERDALAEKVKAMEDNDRRYRWLRESATISWNGYVEYDCLAGGDAEREQMDAAIDAAGGDQC